MLTLKQHRAHPDECRPFLGGNAVVLARSHRELGEAVALCELAQAPEIGPRLFGIARERGHRGEAADLRLEREVALDLLGLDARFGRFAREVDLQERGDLEARGSGLRIERMDELAERVHRPRLAALEVADEVPAK